MVDSRTGGTDTRENNGKVCVTPVNRIPADSLGAESCDGFGKSYHRRNLGKVYTRSLCISFYNRTAYESIIISIKNAVRKKEKKKRDQREFLPEITRD